MQSSNYSYSHPLICEECCRAFVCHNSAVVEECKESLLVIGRAVLLGLKILCYSLFAIGVGLALFFGSFKSRQSPAQMRREIEKMHKRKAEEWERRQKEQIEWQELRDQEWQAKKQADTAYALNRYKGYATPEDDYRVKSWNDAMHRQDKGVADPVIAAPQLNALANEAHDDRRKREIALFG